MTPGKRLLMELAFGAAALLYTYGCLELGAYVQRHEDELEQKKAQEQKIHEGWVCAPYSK